MYYPGMVRWALRVVLVMSLLVVCGCGAAKKQFQTTRGSVTIHKVELSDRFPPDCEADTPPCLDADAGHKYLILWTWWDEVKGPGLSIDDMDRLGDFNEEAAQAHVTADDGSRIDLDGSGMESGRVFLIYEVSDSARGFALHWPNNPEVVLGK